MQEIEDFLTYGREQKGWARTTLAGHRSQLSILVEWYTQTYSAAPALTDLTKEVCQRWTVVRERAGFSSRTRYSGVSSIRALGTWAVEQGLLPDNPGRLLKLPRLDAPNQKSCTEAEKDALMEAAQRRLPQKDQALATALLAVFVYTGLRRFEVCALDVSHICWNDDERRSKLIVRAGKGNKRREIPINSELAQYLKAWLEVRRAPRSEPALWIGLCGKRMSDYMLGEILERVKTAAGLHDHDNISPHGFRHMFATELDRRGVPLAEVQALLGHSNIKTTLDYLQCHREHLYDAVEILTRKSAPAPPPKLQAVKGGQPERFAGPRRSVRLRTA